MTRPILLKKIITRYGSVAAAWSWYLGTSYDLQKNLGAGFTDMLLITDKQNIICYRSQRDLDRVRKRLFALMNQPKQLKTFWKDFSKSHTILSQSLRNVMLKTVQRNSELLARLIEQADAAHRKGWTGLVISYWLPVFLEEMGREKKFAKMYQAALQMRRRYHEHFSLGIQFFDSVHSVTRGATRWLTADEIVQYLKTGKRPWEAQARSHGYYCFKKSLSILPSRSKLEKLLRQKGFVLETNKPVSKMPTLHGMSAYPGMVRGRVKVVLNPTQGKKLNRGDILVAISTEPDYVPLFKRAGAVVTEEGGVVSHAAILSRELKVPCVVGTKVATKVLKDGDRVEVEAIKGVVKKIGK